MTIRVTYNQTCDRCERPFDQKILKAGATVPKIKSKGIAVYLTATEEGVTTIGKTPLASFEDLCDGCRDAVKKLVEKIQLTTTTKRKPKTPKAAKPAEEVAEKPAEEVAEPVEEVAETPAKEEPQKHVDETGEPVDHPDDDGGAKEVAKAEEAPKPKRKRRTKKEMEAVRAAEAAAKEAPAEEAPAEEPAKETPYTEDDSADLGLAGDDNAKAREAAKEDTVAGEEEEADPDDPFPGRETFEDPSTGDIIDVHSGEVLAKREDGGDAGDKDKDGTHPF